MAAADGKHCDEQGGDLEYGGGEGSAALAVVEAQPEASGKPRAYSEGSEALDSVETAAFDGPPVELEGRKPRGYSEGSEYVESLAPGGAMMCKIHAFNNQREEERRRMYHAVIRVFIVTFIAGQTAYISSIVLNWVLGMLYTGKTIAIFGYTSTSCCLMILSTCPYDLLSIDELSKTSPRIFVAFGIAMALIPLARVLSFFPHLDGLLLLICIPIGMGTWWRRLPSWWPAMTTTLNIFLVVMLVAWGSTFFFPEKNGFDFPFLFSAPLGAAHYLVAVFVFALWQLRLRWTSDRAVARAMAFYEAMYTCVAFEGISKAAQGVAMFLWLDELEGLLQFTIGVCLASPAFLLMIIGRTRLFNILGHRFDKDGARLRRDGAFIAELLDNIPVNVGQLYWIHRDVEDERYDLSDPRRKWVQGRVAAVVNESEILVALPDSSQAPTRRGSLVEPSPRTSKVEASLGDPRADFSPRASRTSRVDPAPRPSVKDKFTLLGRAGSKAFNLASTVRVQFNSSTSGKRKEKLLLEAQENLRCVDFESLSPELMVRVDSRNDPELKAKWFTLSRPVRPDETIDYFMSNSWYDDPDKKWQKLCEVAEAYRRRHGRYPTFWLDKLCIDQSSITDGLKVLPVNVMACKKLLALCGDTYLSRLWCIWELFTLFAFVTETSALDRIEFVFLGDPEEGIQTLKEMKNFHVKDSHCYDPNEEARLRQVIDAVGTNRFNQRIASLATLTAARLEQQHIRSSKGWMRKSLSDRSMTRTGSMTRTASMTRTPSERSLNQAALGSTSGAEACLASTSTAEGYVV